MLMSELSKLRLSELQDKCDRVRAFLREQMLDAVWLARQENFAWLTGGGSNHIGPSHVPTSAGLLFTADQIYLVVDRREGERILAEETGVLSPILRPYDGSRSQTRDDLLAELTAGLQHIGSDTPLGDFELINEPFSALRLVLTAAEQFRYRSLCEDTALVLEMAAESIVPGQTEREIAAEIVGRCYSMGIEQEVLLVGADERARRFDFPVPRDTQVFQFVTLALVGSRGGMRTALARMVAVDKLLPEVEDKYHTLTGLAAVYTHFARPGRTTDEILEMTLTACRQEGYPEAWLAHLQHGIPDYAYDGFSYDHPAGRVIEPYQIIAGLAGINGIMSEATFLILPGRNEMLTITHDWPMIRVVLEDRIYYRPDILRL